MDYFAKLLEHFGTQAAAAAAGEISPQLMSKYVKRGAAPLEVMVRWEVASAGAVRAPLPDEVRVKAA